MLVSPTAHNAVGTGAETCTSHDKCVRHMTHENGDAEDSPWLRQCLASPLCPVAPPPPCKQTGEESITHSSVSIVQQVGERLGNSVLLV